MAALSRRLTTALALSMTWSLSFASPLEKRFEEIQQLTGRDTFEWTALGDSYASGVGAGDLTSNSYRCLRYDQAYPVLMSESFRLPIDKKFNNVVCSGSNTEDVEAWQFLDEPTSGKPNIQYGKLFDHLKNISSFC
jgi:hypothetical protein